MLGTGTGVGKTWVAASIVAALRARGLSAVARKPVQSFHLADLETGSTDAHVLAEASGESPESVCPRTRWYELPMAPPIAAVALGRPAFTIADLAHETDWPTIASIGLIETVGGPRSPAAADGDSVTMALELHPDTSILVADSGLGVINAVRLCAPALDMCCPFIVFMNRFDDASDLHRRNLACLTDDGFDVVTSLGQLLDRISPSL